MIKNKLKYAELCLYLTWLSIAIVMLQANEQVVWIDLVILLGVPI
jgi:hypothetical protein